MGLWWEHLDWNGGFWTGFRGAIYAFGEWISSKQGLTGENRAEMPRFTGSLERCSFRKEARWGGIPRKSTLSKGSRLYRDSFRKLLQKFGAGGQ
jgi:hypothetical protein